MKRLLLCALLIVVSLNAFGHAGEVHKYMGTAEMVHKDGSFTLKTTDAKKIDVAVSDATLYRQANGQAASAMDLKAGTRVVVTVSKDGKTASEIKFGAKK